MRLIHRSAWDFLRQNSQGIRFLENASTSPEDELIAIHRMCEKAFCVGSFVVKDSFASLAGHRLCETEVVTKQDQIGEVRLKALRTFQAQLYQLIHLDRERLETNSSSLHTKLQERRQLITEVPTSLSQSLKQSRMTIALVEELEPYVGDYFLQLLSSSSSEDIWRWILLSLGETRYALELIDKYYIFSPSPLFNVTLCLLLESLPNSSQGIRYVPVMFFEHFYRSKKLVSADLCGRSETQTIYCLQIIKRLLDSGLDPNAGFEQSRPHHNSFNTFDKSWSGLSHWQDFLRWLEEARTRYAQSESYSTIYREAMSTCELFVTKGGHFDTSLLIKFPLENCNYPWSCVRRYGSLWDILFEVSAGYVLEAFKTQIGSSTNSIDSLLQDGSHGKECKVWKVEIRFQGERVRLKDDQQHQLYCLSQAYLRLPFLDDSLKKQEALSKVDQIVREFWDASSGYVLWFPLTKY